MVSYLSLLSGRAPDLIETRFHYSLNSSVSRFVTKRNTMILHLLFFVLISYNGLLAANQTDEANVTTATIKQNMCDVCSCNNDGIVNCSSRGLQDHFDDENWPKGPIVEISFVKNSFVHVRAFPNIVINRLILRENSITTIDEAAFREIRNLTELDLSHNQLTTPLLGPHIFAGRFSPEAYTPLAKLEVLNLGHNALHSLHQDLFEHLGSLKFVSLEGNPFGVIDSATVLALSNLPYLEELDLSYCDLEDLPEHIFHTPKYLNSIDLTGNRFSSPPLALEDGKAIKWVSLDENPIKIIDENNAFPIMLSLTNLSLCCMHNLTKIGARAFSGLRNLENLHIEGCPLLEAIDENALSRQGEFSAEWPPLKILELGDNALHYLPAGLVGRWDNLVELDLHNNKWSCDCDNEYLIGSLLPGLGKSLMGDEVSSLTCSLPPEHFGKNLTSLSSRHLRCLDLYNARPEKDATVLVGILIGVLLAVPATLLIFVFWQKGYFFCGTQNPATFSRAFYKRADRDDDF